MKLISNKNSERHFKLLFQNATAEQVYVDVGAFDGDTIEIALEHSDLTVVAIEPIKSLCILMEEKFKGKKVVVVNKACSNENGNVIFYEYPEGLKGLSTMDSSIVQQRPILNIARYEVEVNTLDNILSECSIESVDYLKVDTEGSEEEVLSGFTKYHAGTLFYVEFHMINLANILMRLIEMGAMVDKILLGRDSVKTSHVVGAVTGRFTEKGKILARVQT